MWENAHLCEHAYARMHQIEQCGEALEGELVRNQVQKFKGDVMLVAVLETRRTGYDCGSFHGKNEKNLVIDFA